MFLRQIALLALAAASSNAFVTPAPRQSFTSVKALLKDYDESLQADIARELDYKPGKASSEFAQRFGHLAGAKVKTVGEAFSDFTRELGYSVNALYKNMITDIVGTTHLIVVNARFQRDGIWCIGILNALELLLKNYPDKEVSDAIVTALFKSIGMSESEVRAEAKVITDWAEGKTKGEVEAALRGEGDSPVAAIAKRAKADDLWMYSRFFGIGLVKIMDTVGVEMDKDEVYPVMEDWMSNLLGKSHLTACADSDMFFKAKSKLDMMETMMKEIEIREKKRMVERLEEKAEATLRAAEREVLFQAEIDAEKAEKAKVDA